MGEGRRLLHEVGAAVNSIHIGFDPREAASFGACIHSITSRLTRPLPVHGVILADLQDSGYYWRPMETLHTPSGNVIIIDVISEHPMSTEFAISRFLTPHLATGIEERTGRPVRRQGWALFMDCDIIARENVIRLFDELDERFAVMCVKHNHKPENTVKMDGQIQTRYSRKNWSSVMAFNLAHPANQGLTLDLINTVPGRDLHAFCWLEDDHIGALSPRWNHLVGHTQIEGELSATNPALVHFTDGFPLMRGYENVEFAADFHRELRGWAR